MVENTHETVLYIPTITILIIVSFFFLWGLSVYKNDFSEARILEMRAQEKCITNAFEKTGNIDQSCIKEGYSAVIEVTDATGTITKGVGRGIVSELAFCQASKGTITCLKRSRMINGKGVDIGIVLG